MEKNYIYFSKQGILSNLCAVHAVNNLIGAEFFSQQIFDEICKLLEKQTRSLGLDIKNKHFIGGDYDANVILKALQNCGLITKWIDSRQPYQYKYQQGTVPKGYIINIRQKQNVFKKFLKLSDRHWICLRMYEMSWYLLDSKKQEVETVEDINEFINNFLKEGSQVIEIRLKVNKEEEKEKEKEKEQSDSDIGKEIKSTVLEKYHQNVKNQEQGQIQKQEEMKKQQILEKDQKNKEV